MELGVVSDPRGSKSYRSPCGCSYSLTTEHPLVYGDVIGMCHEHDFYAPTATTASDILSGMRLWVKAQAEEREAA